MNRFIDRAEELFEHTRALRRDFHRHPELGFQEYRTSGIVANTLTELGLEVTTGIGKTGVVAMLEGSHPGPVVLARFDMDALPIQEATGANYASENPGVMHACGHDGHTAIGLTVARILNEHAHELHGSVKFVFQPAEEGLGGAQAMIADGVLDNPAPDYSLGVHVWNEKPFGWVGVTQGPLMASGEIFRVTIRGKGGHGALPNLAVDPVLAGAQIVSALQSIVSRNVSPLESAVVSVTAFNGGESFNVIPEVVELQGTIRTYLPQVRLQVVERFESIITGIAEAMGCRVEIDLRVLTPAVINDPAVAQKVAEVAKQLFTDADIDNGYMSTVSEDMAYIMQKVPGCFIMVGSANADKGLNAPHHHPMFNFDERALLRSAGLVSASIAHILAN